MYVLSLSVLERVKLLGYLNLTQIWSVRNMRRQVPWNLDLGFVISAFVYEFDGFQEPVELALMRAVVEFHST